MSGIFQIPRLAFAWLLSALVIVILPHVLHMPVWLTLLCLGCIVIRTLIYQGRLSYPGIAVKILLVTSTMIAMVLQFGRDVVSTDSTVAIMIAGITLKLLEMKKKRDVLLVIYLCYFTIVAEFIYSQSIFIALYSTLSLVMTTCALMSLHQSGDCQLPGRTLKLSSLILAQSVPVMLVMFLLFPRISPLWAVPLQNAGGVTGLGEDMSPGDIGNLTRSDERVFKVQFLSQSPPQSELYWQGLTMERFDGRRWTRNTTGGQSSLQPLRIPGQETREWFSSAEFIGERVDYDVILEPTYNNWIFTLKLPQIYGENLFMTNDFQVVSSRNISQRFNYQASSFLNYRTDPELSPVSRSVNLRLPAAGNPESRAFAERLREESVSSREYIDSVLTHFREQAFFYTLSPATLGSDAVDEFLFSTREGFCEHYASSFAFLMRAAGIPARIVTGYQGGELNPYDSTLIVRQYDAHAWTEVWLEDQGWVRVDPTAAVAPDRINLGSDITFQQEEAFLQDAGFSLLRLRGNLLINDLRLRLETIDYAWSRWVLNYNQERQYDLLSRLFSDLSGRRIILTLLVLVFGSVLLTGLFLLSKPTRLKTDPATRLYLGYCRMLSGAGLGRKTGETPMNYYRRLRELRPHWASEMKGITETYVDITYRPQEDETELGRKLRILRQKIRQFRLLK